MSQDSGPEMESSRLPRNGKEAAVQQWNDALALLDGETEDERALLDADIHDRRDRMEIEEIIHHGDIPEDAFGALEDAFDDLRTEFDDLWN